MSGFIVTGWRPADNRFRWHGRAELPREFRSDQSSFGTIYSQPLRAVDWVKPRPPLRAFHGTLYEGHQNNLLVAILFRSEFINFFNHPQFSEPNLRMSSDTFGYITNTANRGRLIQLYVRLRW